MQIEIEGDSIKLIDYFFICRFEFCFSVQKQRKRIPDKIITIELCRAYKLTCMGLSSFWK